MKASDLLVACLEREGVEHIFGLPGEEMEDLLFSLRDSAVTFVPVRHEQGAAFMADVHGRLTGDAGVCLSTLGPGATNLLTGIADAHLDKSPLVAITAQGGLERLHKESHQAIDVLRTFEPVTKWNTQLDSPDIIHESVRKAFKVAEYEKPGATHLELPEDVAREETETRPLPNRDQARFASPNPESLDRVKGLLREARRPVVIAGNGAVRTHAAAQLRELVAATDMPVVSTYMGKGAVSDDDERSLMTLDSGTHGEAASAIQEADLLLTVGYDIAEHDPADWGHTTPAPGGTGGGGGGGGESLADAGADPQAEAEAEADPDSHVGAGGADSTATTGRPAVVHVDSQPAEVYEAYNPDVEVVADIGRTLRELAEWCGAADLGFDRDWYAELREHIVEDVQREPASDPPFTVRDVLPLLREAMAPEDVLISDVGSHKMAIAQNFPTYEPNTCIISNGLASMGIAVPGGLAADLAIEPNVVAATGDGGFLMNAAEIETATRIGCGYTIVVFNDNDYGLISEQQREHTGQAFGTGLTNPDFVSFAESFGIEGHRPASPTELRDAFGTIGDGSMSLIEVPVE